MATRLVYSLGLLAAAVAALWDGAPEGAMAFLMFAMVALGAAYAVLNIDHNNPQAYILTALVIVAAGGGDVVTHIYAVGPYIDSILDQVAVVYLSGGAAVFGMRAWSLVSKGSL